MHLVEILESDVMEQAKEIEKGWEVKKRLPSSLWTQTTNSIRLTKQRIDSTSTGAGKTLALVLTPTANPLKQQHTSNS